jgi:hypothetical protein
MRLILAYMLVMAAMAPAALGPELVRNGDFFVDEEWQKGTGWTIAEGNALHVSTGFSRGLLVQIAPLLEPGATYEVRYRVTEMETVGLGYVQLYLGGTPGSPIPVNYEVAETLTAGDSGCIEFEPVMAAGSTCRIDNVSVRRIIESDLAADFDDDGAVGANDLTVFAAGWLSAGPDIPGDLDDDGTVNLVDFALFAADWGLGASNTPPVASDQAATVMVGQAINLTLAATDSDFLTYKITQAPTLGSLTRITGGVYRYRPYLESEGTDVIKWQCSDGREVSNEATVTVTVLPVVLDNLRYDGPALIEIEDGANINLDDDCMLTCWFRTLWPEGVLLSKRAEGGGPGVVVEIRDGCVVTTLAGQDGIEHVVACDLLRIDDGQWWFYGLDLTADPNAAGNVNVLVSGTVGENHHVDEREVRIDGLDLSNSAPLRVGRYRDRAYYGAIDYLTNTASTGGLLRASVVLLEKRIGSAHALSPAYYRKFPINEGAGAVITDEVGGIEGTLSNHGRINWSTPDAALDSRGRQRSRLRGVEGNTMIPDFRKRN